MLRLDPIAVAVLGCTGAVGQKFIALLANHPFFNLTEIVASENSANKKYCEIVNWKEPTPIPENIKNLIIKNCTDYLSSKILFSALDAEVAGEIEEKYAKAGHIVISNSRNHRMDDDVPLVIPEINADHLQICKLQQLKNNSQGFIVTNPNCSITMAAIALHPIYQTFGLSNVLITTMQAISGAGYPGVASLDILGNIIPHIKGEEEKMQLELLKIFGKYSNNKIDDAKFNISAMCNRVPVYHGHTESIAFKTITKASHSEILEAFSKWVPLALPSSPATLIQYFDQPSRPQPLLDVNLGNGMTVTIGNLRQCDVLDWKMTVLGHNLIRGAAGAAILNAEYLVKNNIN